MNVLPKFLLDGAHQAKELFKRANSAFISEVFPYAMLRCPECDEDDS